LLIGVAGMALPIIQPHLPIMLGFAVASLGLALLCINATSSSYKHGFVQLFFTILLCGAAAGVLGAAYKLFLTRITDMIVAQPARLVPILLIALWLAAAATLPLPLAIGGLISGLVSRSRQRRGKG
jgi:hypothetical protein